MNKLSGGIIGTGVGMMAGAVKVVANTISNAIGSVSNTMGAVAMINLPLVKTTIADKVSAKLNGLWFDGTVPEKIAKFN
ncbi:hypothetical protein EHS11_02740 [Leptospira ilyithenensis]|uniref:Uncharacterized protein n=1 Tax=Leptospira ilyithenensis TaxID=2484901 RepID=A0A4R9LTW9_9LEPT|nr:hypothetical protein EHS11_02740 [Leptospira ilyithenensis]